MVKIATAVSELARNVWSYAGRGGIEIAPVDGDRRSIAIEARDSSPGIRDVETVLSGRYRSKTGLGLGLAGCRRRMDGISSRFTLDDFRDQSARNVAEELRRLHSRSHDGATCLLLVV